MVVGDQAIFDKVFNEIKAVLGTTLRKYAGITEDQINTCARAISGTSTPEEVLANGFYGPWSNVMIIDVNSVAQKITNCPAAKKLVLDVLTDPFFTDPAHPVQRPPPAGDDAAPPAAGPPEVEEDISSEVAPLQRHVARLERAALATNMDTFTISQLAGQAEAAGVSLPEIDKAMDGDNTRDTLHGLLAAGAAHRGQGSIPVQRGTLSFEDMMNGHERGGILSRRFSTGSVGTSPRGVSFAPGTTLGQGHRGFGISAGRSQGVPSTAARAAMGQHRTADPPVVNNVFDREKIVEFILSADPRGQDLSASEKKERQDGIPTVLNGSTHAELAELAAALGVSWMSDIGDPSNSQSEPPPSGRYSQSS